MTQSSGRALILSGSIGAGHDTVAEACAAALSTRGWQTVTRDAVELLGGGASQAADAVFRRILAIPPLYDALYFSALRTGNRLARAMDWAAARKAAPAVTALVDREDPDLVISVFATAAAVVSRIKKERPNLRSVVLCTDVTPHRLWVHERTDLYLVTSEPAARAVERFQPDARVAVVGVPLRPQFAPPPDRGAARRTLGVSLEKPCVLLMSGGWGLGPIAAIAEALAREGIQVLAVAGQNRRLQEQLDRLASMWPTVLPFGFTDRVAELMAASDLVVTSTGNTCFEARSLGRHVLLLDVVPGHGRDNLQHQLELGSASVVSADPDAVVRSALQLLKAGGPVGGPPLAQEGSWGAQLRGALSTIGVIVS